MLVPISMQSSLQRFVPPALSTARSLVSLSSISKPATGSDCKPRCHVLDWRPLLLLGAAGGGVALGADGCKSRRGQPLQCDVAKITKQASCSKITLKTGKDRKGLHDEATDMMKALNLDVKDYRASTEVDGGAVHTYRVRDHDTGMGLSKKRLDGVRRALSFISSVDADVQSWPTVTRDEVARHTTKETGIWVTYKDGVYDITEFIANHPGGIDKIMLAAGKAIDPFWRIYQQHEGRGNALKQLADMRIGDLADPPAPSDSSDPYDSDPERHPGLLFHNNKPCNAEVPAELMMDNWLTPNPVWFIRHHHPVPVVDDKDFKLLVEGDGTLPVALTMEDLKKRFLKREVVTTIQCGGNRRSEFNKVDKTSGITWGFGAVSTARWGGVYLREVLMHCAGLSLETVSCRGIQHVVFHGLDEMQASIPIEKALSPFGDVLIAYEMNGEPLPAEHGAPVRVVVPGVVGVRNVKWVSKICTSQEEAEGTWQRGAAYKPFPPNVKSFDGVDLSKIPSIQEMPVQSSIVHPKPGAKIDLDDVEVRGFAWSGGGRGIIRVDVSIDNGKTWTTAEMLEGQDQPLSRAWAWTFWEASLPVPEDQRGKEIEICCRATDSSCNVQPERLEPIWNIRGLNCNSWHRVTVQHDDSE